MDRKDWVRALARDIVLSLASQDKLRPDESLDSYPPFLHTNRTSDHLLTLRTLIDKYVHCHSENVCACFVDYKKAFDSVWDDGLLRKLLPIGVGLMFL